MRIEEDVDEGGGDGWQSLGVQREDAESVLWALDGVHGGLGPPGEGPDGGQGERPTVGRGAPWGPAREPAWAGSRVRQHLQEAAWVLPAPS